MKDSINVHSYSAYGSPSGVTAGAFVPGTAPAGVTLRDAFSGKEDQQPDFGVPWLDFGARAYSPALRRWMVPDPLGEKYRRGQPLRPRSMYYPSMQLRKKSLQGDPEAEIRFLRRQTLL